MLVLKTATFGPRLDLLFLHSGLRFTSRIQMLLECFVNGTSSVLLSQDS